MIYIGIDPGKNGALASICGDSIHLIPFSEEEYMQWLFMTTCTGEETFCALERVGAMPGQGVTSMFNFGRNYGFIQGLLEASFIPYELVTPQKWKKALGVTGDKNSSIAVCKRLFPGVSLKRTERCAKDHDGMAEALLLAEYARRARP